MSEIFFGKNKISPNDSSTGINLRLTAHQLDTYTTGLTWTPRGSYVPLLFFVSCLFQKTLLIKNASTPSTLYLISAGGMFKHSLYNKKYIFG